MNEIKTNDFVVRFANVNGTGSVSVNVFFTNRNMLKFIRGKIEL
ncbi:MAG TPA: hypothetical protein PKE69_26790 [Pyrinomonadaceae bacterium]|nr:hypothetical protein [Pyrinomonadaceae bacterium]